MGADYKSGARAEPSAEFAFAPRAAHFVACGRLAVRIMPWNSPAVLGRGSKAEAAPRIAEQRAARPSTAPFAIGFAVLMALACVPLLLTPLPPLFDYPNHLARMHLLPSLPDAALRRYYIVHWRPIPDLGMDAVVPFLARLMPFEWAGKLFIALTFLLLAGGTAAIHRVLFGRWSLWTLLAFLLLYTRLLLWGFMSYLFGCGLGLAAFAAWLALRRRHWALRLAVGTISALAIYFAHLLAFGLYAVALGCYELREAWRLRKGAAAAIHALVIGGVPFLPALVLMAMNAAPGRIVYGNPARKIDLLFSVFDNYSRPFDVACFVLAVLAIGFAFGRRWVRIAPGMGLPLLGLTVAYLAMPTQLFTASGVDRRVPMMIFLMLIGGSAWQRRYLRIESRFMAGAALLFAVRLAVIAAIWLQAGRLYARLLPGLEGLPRQSCLAVAFGRDSIEVGPAPLTHFAVLSVAQRDALVTTIFHAPLQHPIELRPEAKRLAELLGPGTLWSAFATGAKPLTAAARAALAECGHVAFAEPHPFVLKNTTGLAPEFLSPRFKIYRVATAAPP